MKTAMQGPQEDIGRILELIVRSLVTYPDDVRIEPEYLASEEVTVFHIATAVEEDLAKLIGRHGRTARSIRTIISACSMRYKLRVAIRIDNKHDSRQQ